MENILPNVFTPPDGPGCTAFKMLATIYPIWGVVVQKGYEKKLQFSTYPISHFILETMQGTAMAIVTMEDECSRSNGFMFSDLNEL